MEIQKETTVEVEIEFEVEGQNRDDDKNPDGTFGSELLSVIHPVQIITPGWSFCMTRSMIISELGMPVGAKFIKTVAVTRTIGMDLVTQNQWYSKSYNLAVIKEYTREERKAINDYVDDIYFNF